MSLETMKIVKSISAEKRVFWAILQETGVFQLILEAIQNVINKTDRLTTNSNNNPAELFMSIFSKFNAGKRLNLTSRGSFQRRCTLTALSYQRGYHWHSIPWQNTVQRSTGKYFKKYISSRENQKKFANENWFMQTELL